MSVSFTKKTLLSMCNVLGIRVAPNVNKTELHKLIKEHEETKNVKIIESGKKIKYIYHTADIHIRILDRHTEYREVFETLYTNLKSQEDLYESVLVICGDIFHSRDKLVPECIKLFDDFIEKLTSIIDVVLILGNHDTFTHNDRLDTISGIVDIKNYKNFHFLKTSGVYKYNNIDFVVSSLVDNVFIRHVEIHTSPCSTSVALYHGAVAGSKIDSSFSLTDSLFSVGDFKGFDLVLLGDIHLRQYLTPNIAYPGSLIQQNFKEELDHGILKWNVETKESMFIKINNNYGYVTVDIEKIQDTFFPKKSRIKLIHSYNKEFDIEKIKSELNHKTTIISLTKEIKTDQLCTTPNVQLKVNVKVTEYSIFEKLIENFDKNTKEELSMIHNNYSNDYALQQDECLNSLSWKIKELEFMNVFIYGNDHINKIIFDKKMSVIGILESNASGKSSIFNIIMYILFGNSYMKSKNYSNRNIINKSSKIFYIKMTIEDENGILYIIEKNGKNKTRNTETGIEETVIFKKIENKITTNLTDSNKINTVSIIHKTLGLSSKDVFILTNVLSNVQYVSLLNMTASDISDTFSKLFNLQKYNEIYSIVLKKCKEFSDNIKHLEGQIKSLESNKTDLKELKHKKHETSCNILVYIEHINRIDKLLEELLQEEIDLGKVVVLQEPREILGFEEKIIECTKKLNEINLESLKSKVDTISKTITNLHMKKINIKKCITNSEYQKIKKSEQFSIKDFITDLISYNNTNRYTENVSIPKDLYDDILELLNELDKEEYLSNAIKIKEYETINADILFNESLKNEINSCNIELTKLNIYINEYELLENTIIKLKEHKSKLELFNTNKDNIVLKNKIISSRLFQTDKKEYWTKMLGEFHINIGKFDSLIDSNIETTNKISKIKEELETLLEKYEIYKIYKNIMCDKNLPKMVLVSTIKKIEIDANIMIYKLIGLYILFNTEKDDGKWEITIKKNNMILGIEHVSGFERLVINIGLKIALDKYQHNSSINFFAIDECLDCVSDDNYHKVDDIFKLLKDNYHNVLIISHNENLKNKVDSRIKIKTDFVCSKIA